MPPFPREQAIRDIEVTLGRRIDDLFVEFGDVVGAASIAQVHKARVLTRDGAYRDVAVKVIRPGVRLRFRRELEAFAFIARVLETFVRSSRRLRPVAVVETLAQSTRIEMDLRLEAAASSEMADNVANDPHFRVPGIDWERTGRDVLTMEWIDGIKMNDVAAVRAAGHDLPRPRRRPRPVVPAPFDARRLLPCRHAPRNLFVVPDGTIVAVDLGIVGRLTADSRRFSRRDPLRLHPPRLPARRRGAFRGGLRAAHAGRPVLRAGAARAIGEPIHGQPAETISMAHLLTLLFEVTELFDMQTRPELVLLQKTMVVVEGVARSYDRASTCGKPPSPW